jgi:hypothetical protein
MRRSVPQNDAGKDQAMKYFLLSSMLVLVVAGAHSQTASQATGSTGAQAATFRCGGVGDEDQKRMKAEAPQHALLVTFATTDGAYLSNIDVEIRRNGQVVLQGRCNGPLMLVDVAPAGSYEIAATSQGRTQRKTVAVGARPASVTISWPS